MLGKKLIINDRMEIDLTQEVDPIIIECLNTCEVELKKADGQDTFEVIYTPDEDTKFFQGEGEDADTIYLVGKQFDDIFHQVLIRMIEEAMNNGYFNEANFIDKELSEPAKIEQPVIAETPQPGILEQFANGCSYYFNQAWGTVFPKNKEGREPESAADLQKQPSPKPSNP